MRAFSPTGSQIVAMSDMVAANALIQPDSFDRLPDGSLGIEWAGDSEVFWDAPVTNQRGGARNAAEEMLTALKAIMRCAQGELERPLMQRQLWDETQMLVEAAIAKAEQPAKDLFVDEDGQEWIEDEIVLLDGDKMDAAGQAGYEVDRDGGKFKTHLLGHGDVMRFNTFAEAWAAILKEMEGRVSEP